MKSVKLEWCLGDIKKARDLLDESVKHYPNFAKVSVFQYDLYFADYVICVYEVNWSDWCLVVQHWTLMCCEFRSL